MARFEPENPQQGLSHYIDPMPAVTETLWGPSSLPNLLREQLDAHGFAETDAQSCAAQMTGTTGPAARASLFVDLGACKFLEGDVDGAMAAWRHAVASGYDPVAARALTNLGLMYEHLDLHEQAIRVFAGAVERAIEPHASHAAMATARCYHAAGQPELAMETMARLAQSTMLDQPDSAALTETLFGLGEIAEAANRYDRAERAWRVAAAGAASDTQRAATDRLVPLLLEVGNDHDLIDVLERQPQRSMVQHAPALLDRVEWLVRNGRDDQAQSLARAIAGDDLPHNERFRLAEVRLQAALVNEAIDELEVLIATDDDEIRRRAAFTLGEVYQTYDMAEAAASMFERVVDEGDRYWAPRGAIPLGDILLVAGKRDEAMNLWVDAASSAVPAVRHAAEERLADQERRAREAESLVEQTRALQDAQIASEQRMAVEIEQANEAKVAAEAAAAEAQAAADQAAAESQARAAEQAAAETRAVAAAQALADQRALAQAQVAEAKAAADAQVLAAEQAAEQTAVEEAARAEALAIEQAEAQAAVEAKARAAEAQAAVEAKARAAEQAAVEQAAIAKALAVEQAAIAKALAVEQAAAEARAVEQAAAEAAALAAEQAHAVAMSQLEPVVVPLSSLDDDPTDYPDIANGDFGLGIRHVDPMNDVRDLTGGEELGDPDFVDALNDVGDLAGGEELGDPDFVDALNDVGDLVGSEELGDPDFVDALNDVGDLVGGEELGDPDFVDPMNDVGDLVSPMSSDSQFLGHEFEAASDLDRHDLSRAGLPETSNPYAALAPDELDADVVPSGRNPYAELAPNFETEPFHPGDDVEPGDWESMIDVPDSKPAPKSSGSTAFSRYT